MPGYVSEWIQLHDHLAVLPMHYNGCAVHVHIADMTIDDAWPISVVAVLRCIFIANKKLSRRRDGARRLSLGRSRSPSLIPVSTSPSEKWENVVNLSVTLTFEPMTLKISSVSCGPGNLTSFIEISPCIPEIRDAR